jgi:hypothetical protein
MGPGEEGESGRDDGQGDDGDGDHPEAGTPERRFLRVLSLSHG